MRITDWHGCYDTSLKGLIVPEAFAHPAKMAMNLTKRIYAHGAMRGFWRPGDTIVDPFGGIGTTGLIGAYRGYQVISCELEPRFVDLAQLNIAKHAGKLRRLGMPVPVHVQGDSRQLCEVVAGAVGAITSPPFGDAYTGRERQAVQAGTVGDAFARAYHMGAITSPPYVAIGVEKNGKSIDRVKQYETYRASGGGASFEGFCATQELHSQGYGDSDGQLSAMKAGDLAAVIGAITSPPYADSAQSTDAEFVLQPTAKNPTARKLGTRNYYPAHGTAGIGAITSPPYGGNDDRDFTSVDRDRRRGHRPERQVGSFRGAYSGETAEEVNPANAGDMVTGDHTAVVGAITSPPYADSVNQSAGANDAEARLERKALAGVDITQAIKRGGPNSVLNQSQVYGETAGQVGALSGDTYWEAVAAIYGQLYQLLPVGGAAAVVVKDYVKNKTRVPLCDQTCELLEALGFTVVERCRAHLVKTSTTPTLFGVDHTSTTERKSFFRRLAEKKGSPRIDWEEVIWAVKGVKRDNH